MNCTPVMRHLAVFCAALVAAMVTAMAVPAHAAPAHAATRPPIGGTPTGCADLPSRAAALAKTGVRGTATCLRGGQPAGVTTALPVDQLAIASAPPCGQGTWILTRTSMCANGEFQLVVYTVPNGVVIGVLDFAVTATVALSGRTDQWTTTVRFVGQGGTGAIGGTILNVIALCGTRCSYTSDTGFSGPFGTGTTLNGQATFASTYGGVAASWTSSSYWQFTFSNQAWTPPVSNALSIQPPEHRCDDALPGRPVGCTVHLVTPVHQVSSLAHPTYARHISLAQNYYRLPSQLTRTTNSALIDSNRRVACTDPQGRPRPPGKSCDEYPFATTYQGASLQPYGRTINIVGGINGSNPGFFCSVPWLNTRQLGDSGGFSACMIPDTENSDGGTLLGLFYYDNRVIERDEFIVRVV